MLRRSTGLSQRLTIRSPDPLARNGIGSGSAHCITLYYPGARLIPTAKPGENDDFAPQMLDVHGFIARVESYFAEHGFYEKEIARRTEQFGRIAHVWSTYESRQNADDTEPFMRGINSIQLFHDGSRWWIVSIYWQHESPEHPVPEEYL